MKFRIPTSSKQRLDLRAIEAKKRAFLHSYLMLQSHAPISKWRKNMYKHSCPSPLVSSLSFLVSVGYYHKLP